MATTISLDLDRLIDSIMRNQIEPVARSGGPLLVGLFEANRPKVRLAVAAAVETVIDQVARELGQGKR